MDYLQYKNYLAHHGIIGQKWGERNGPPYPLDPNKDYSPEEKKLNKVKNKLWNRAEKSISKRMIKATNKSDAYASKMRELDENSEEYRKYKNKLMKNQVAIVSAKTHLNTIKERLNDLDVDTLKKIKEVERKSTFNPFGYYYLDNGDIKFRFNIGGAIGGAIEGVHATDRFEKTNDYKSLASVYGKSSIRYLSIKEAKRNRDKAAEWLKSMGIDEHKYVRSSGSGTYTLDDPLND